MTGFLSAAGLTLGAIVVTPGLPLEHRTQVAHESGMVEVHYTGTVELAPIQRGAPAPGGRASTLHCEWRARMNVDRQARHAEGGLLARSIDNAEGLTLSRPGWCHSHRAAVEQQLAGRSAELQQRLLAIVEQDRPVLLAQVDRQQGQRTAG